MKNMSFYKKQLNIYDKMLKFKQDMIEILEVKKNDCVRSRMVVDF